MLVSKEQARELVTMLRNNVPVDTGNLKANISDLQMHPKEYVIVIGGPKAPYAPYVKQKGTHNQVPNQWVEKTINEWAKKVERSGR